MGNFVCLFVCFYISYICGCKLDVLDNMLQLLNIDPTPIIAVCLVMQLIGDLLKLIL